MELDLAVRGRIAKKLGQEKFRRDALQHERGMVRKPKTDVERRIAHKHTPIGSDSAQFGKTSFHKRWGDATALQVGFNRNGAKPIPASGAITDGDG